MEEEERGEAVEGRLIVPCNSSRARPDGVWSRVGRGFGAFGLVLRGEFWGRG
jgi:hypothetical protein